MANIEAYRDKDGVLKSFNIRVFRGRGADGKQLKPARTTFEVKASWSEETARKKAEAFAATFEKEIKNGTITDTRQTFQAFSDYVIELKENRGIKHTTITSYRYLTKRIYPEIGHIKLKDLRVDHLNSLYLKLSNIGEKKQNGGEQPGKLSNKTILEHHRFISTVLEEAVKEGLIPFNIADRATPPKKEHKEVNYFQLEQIQDIQEAMEKEPLKWQTLIHLLMITGARRGEILGLKWDKVNFEKQTLYICNNILYTPDKGVYESTPKTEKSKRFISIPIETINLLKQYKAEQAEEFLKVGIKIPKDGFIFSQANGKPLHPDSVTKYLTKFSKKYNLPHINAHAFRHTMASVLYFNGVDSVSISKRLGHAQVSTTTDIYAHIMEEAENKNSDIISNIYFKKA